MRCPQCGSDNPSEYRFCGMCGTPLVEKDSPVPEPVSVAADRPSRTDAVQAKRQPESVSTLSGPSFLGLGSEPARDNGRVDSDVSYLYEDERPRRTYWRFTLLLLIVAIVGALAYLQYSRAGKAWVAPWANGPAQTPVQASQADPQTTPGQQTPAPNANQNGTAAANSANDGNAAPQASTQANAQGPTEQDIPPAGTPPQAAANNSEKAPADNADSGNNATSSSAEAKNDESAKAEAPADNSANDENADAEPAKPARPSKPRAARPVSTTPVSPDDALVSNAEKYLYGRGVPQNCDRALTSLRTAADRSNGRALSLLGTMYATGHCVPKDLPNAYRWFAQASRGNPDNMWVQRNLEMIWREMTPQERQLATRSQ